MIFSSSTVIFLRDDVRQKNHESRYPFFLAFLEKKNNTIRDICPGLIHAWPYVTNASPTVLEGRYRGV